MVIFTVHKNTIHSMNYWRLLEWILAFRSSNGDWLYHINYIVCTLIYSNKGTYLMYMYIKIKTKGASIIVLRTIADEN